MPPENTPTGETPIENKPSDSATETTETVDQDTTNTPVEQPSGETPEAESPEGTSQEGAAGQPTQDPAPKQEDKADPAKAAMLADLHKARSDRKIAQDRVTELESQVAELTPIKDTLDAVQRKYDRLEAFLTSVGGPLSRALDSKSFTEKLFESDEDISSLVTEWHRANPSATTSALSSGAAAHTGNKIDPNVLLRAAAGK